MKRFFESPAGIKVWQILFLLFNTTWLFAPQLNHALSYRTSLISQYESPAQPYSIALRAGDLVGGLLLAYAAYYFLRKAKAKKVGILLLITAAGMTLDPILTTTCKTSVGNLGTCVEYYSYAFLLHAIETTFTACALFVLTVYDATLRKKLVSINFAFFQVAYFGLFLTQYATHARYNTLSQFIYQLFIAVWLAWFCRDFLAGEADQAPTRKEGQFIKYGMAGWAFLNGILAIVLSIWDIQLLGRLHGLYFTRDNAWLAQHSVAVGIIMLYLSRHLARGERRARQLFLAVIGLEALKYSVITPNLGLLILYLATFCILFVWRDVFDRGTIALTWYIRLKDLLFMVIGLSLAALISLLLLDRDGRVSLATTRAFRHFHDYVLSSKVFPKEHLSSILLAHTISAFLVVGGVSILWIAFRPSKVKPSGKDYPRIEALLKRLSSSAEDFFKLWPADKSYYWQADRSGFVAYKVVGSVAFCLADPVAAGRGRARLISDFTAWARERRLTACFLPVYPDSLDMYESAGLATIQIGASALINSRQFLSETVNDKWWRWQKNRAAKSGYNYVVATPPHQTAFLDQLKEVSDAWLAVGGHQERGFALGYFDEDYLQRCVVHYLTDPTGKVIAFTNQLPVFKHSEAATVDLLRYLPDFNNAMPFLMQKTIEQTHASGSRLFDLGFVPFAALNNPALQLAKILSAGRFSSKGLEQFKNKFNPQWQPNYMAYDGDLADLALIAINLEKAMDV